MQLSSIPGLIGYIDSDGGDLKRELLEFVTISSSQLSELTGIPSQTINSLRKEGILEPVGKKTLTAKSDGFRYRIDVLKLLIKGRTLGLGKTLTQSIRTIQHADTVKRDAASILKAFSAVVEMYRYTQNKKSFKPQDGSELQAIVEAAFGELSCLTQSQKNLLIACTRGEFPVSDDSAINIRQRRALDEAEAKIMDTLLIFVRLTFMNFEELLQDQPKNE